MKNKIVSLAGIAIGMSLFSQVPVQATILGDNVSCFASVLEFDFSDLFNPSTKTFACSDSPTPVLVPDGGTNMPVFGDVDADTEFYLGDLLGIDVQESSLVISNVKGANLGFLPSDFVEISDIDDSDPSKVITGITVTSTVDGDLSVLGDLADLGFVYDSDTVRFKPPENALIFMNEGETWTIDLDITASTQETPVLPDLETDLCTIIISSSCFSFTDVPSGLWFDPPTARGFEYAMISSESYFTEILELPSNIIAEGDKFQVFTKAGLFGEFSAGETVVFEGAGVKSFRIEGIDPPVDPDNPDAFPVKLAFTTPRASFEMSAITTEVPEPLTLLGTGIALGFGALFKNKGIKKV